MAGRPTVEIRGVEAVLRDLKRIPGLLTQVAHEWADFTEVEAETLSKPHPGDVGRFHPGTDYIRQEARDGVPLHARVYTNSPIVAEVERGRRPGGRRPPIRLLKVWSERHGITESTKGGDIWKAAFRIARAIGTGGSKGVGMFARAAAAGEAKLPEMARRAEKRIEAMWGRR